MTLIRFSNGYAASLTARGRTKGVQGAIYGHSGAEFPEVEVRGLEGTLRDGGTIFGSRRGMRRITLAVDFRGVTRKQLARDFVPGTPITLSRVTPSGGMLTGETIDCYLPCVLDSATFASSNLNSTKLSLSFLSEEPFPLGMAELVQGTATVDGGLEYPYEYPYKYEGVDTADRIDFWSRTEVPAEPVITFTASLVAASLTLTITEAIVIDTAIADGDVVVVDSANRTVTINGVNSLEHITESSEWPTVVPGNNTVSSSSMGLISVTYEPRLVGLL